MTISKNCSGCKKTLTTKQVKSLGQHRFTEKMPKMLYLNCLFCGSTFVLKNKSVNR